MTDSKNAEAKENGAAKSGLSALVSSNVSNREKLLRCRSWVESIEAISPQDLVDLSHKAFQSSSLNDDEEIISLRKRKRDKEEAEGSPAETKRKRVSMRSEVILHECEWLGCGATHADYVLFQQHVRAHMPDLLVKHKVYVCLWDICGFETEDPREIKRHVMYHAYHTRLKTIGRNLSSKLQLQRCTGDSTKRNQLPHLPTDYACQWVACTHTACTIQELIDHVRCHVMGAESPLGKLWVCGWLGCGSRFTTHFKLGEHSKTHTRERLVACSHCGTSFSTTHKYKLHTERQIPVIDSEFACGTCNKLFATERLMLEHERCHIMSYKCSFCDMSLLSPSALAQHIRYRHLNYKPFHCQHCTYKAVSSGDLSAHMLRHQGVPRPRRPRRMYACHCCSRLLSSGSTLTQHLLRVHGYNTPKGFSRLRYEESSDGVYRLVPVRYERLEVTEQVTPPNADALLQEANEQENVPETQFKIVQLAPGTSEQPANFHIILPDICKEEMMEESVEVEVPPLQDQASLKPKKGRPKKKSDQKPGTSLMEHVIVKKQKKPLSIHEFSCMKRFRADKEESPGVRNIEISIQEVDLHGNVITSQLESQQILV